MSNKFGECCEHGDDDDDSDMSDTEREEERVRLWQYTLGRRCSRTDLGELCNTLSHWSGHRDWARAVCTLLPSRRRSTAYSERFAAATLPAMSRASIEDPDTLIVRRQLSSASHRRRTGSSCLNRALSMRSPGGLDAYDSVFDSGQEEPLSEEEQVEMRAAIQSLPVPLAMRRLFRNQLQRSPPQEGEKFDAWNLKSFKAMKKASELGRDITTWLTMWSSALKTIEGHFGTGVVSYFLFLRWLLLLNLLMFLLPALFIITPHWILPTVFEPNETAYTAVTTILTDLRVMELSSVRLSAPNLLSAAEMDDVWAAGNRTLPKMQECYDKYHTRVAGQTKGGISQLQDFLQGTGWMELTALFAGRYINSVDHIAGTKLRYNFPLAYVLTNVACFVLCLLLMVRYTTAGVREALLVSEGKLHRYCNMVFASWDFCITDERTARLKHVSIVQELKSDLAEERRRAEIASWSRRKKVGLFVVRLLVNLFVVAVIVGSLFAVYNATSFSFQRQSQAQTTHKTLALVIQFVPSLVITGLNLIVPALFSKLIRLENYSVAFQVKLTLLRTVFLRFTSIFVLLLSLYKQINCSPVRENNCLEGYGDCKKPMCWETAVGQQIYKLTMLDFIVGVTLVFVVECPRKLIVTRCECKLAKVIGQQEFNIPNRVLDLVYSQTLCWLGTFYCPLLPAITLIKYFIIFYVQKFTLMNNSAPSQTPYRASRSNTFFVIVLLLALFLAVIPFSYALVEIQPSLSCGPFQKYFFTWEVVPDLINSWKDHPWGWYVVKAVDFLTSVAFGVPVVVVLAISIYYYYSVAAAHAHMEKVLKDKLVLEGKDKQFLLARITEVARQRPSSTA
ncbi:transmembrane channel-like protein 7 isoform X3 [Dermacentor andersoni]|uniref:transmembrane channel-like protein 7 isoform X3 n=2 Tax=Dermacentor andersoni TaxID=34620 RepID=UPI0021552A70|nr:transmembrane channel-like protein 7 isoform X2 [Dermacentor andersoni]